MMTGFRILVVILGLLCLAMALGLFFHNRPVAINIINRFLQEQELQDFIKTGNVVVKNHLKYALCGSSIFALGLGLLFLISAVSPLQMRPFIVVVIILSIIWIPLAIWVGLSLNISKLWWIGDAIGCLILAILLATFFPKKAPKVKPAPEPPSEELEE